MTKEDQELFDKMIIEDGRHRLLFEQWQSGEITEDAFHQGESVIMDEVMRKTNTLMCRHCNPLAS
jgi:hypothetical protein